MIARLWRERLYRPEALALVARDVAGTYEPVLDTRVHLHEAAAWLARAQDATPDAGVSAGYAFEDGWIASYPETTGYIIPTLLTYAERSGQAVYRERALRMAEWELTLQHEGGGFPGHFVDRAHAPVVFNTGQVIFGLLAAAEATGQARFLDAAGRAGAWLAAVQDPDGAWRRFDYCDTLHSYNSRTAWALVELAQVTGDDALLETGWRNLTWVCAQQSLDGWIEHAGFTGDAPPFLHTIAYASQGLLEAGRRLKEPHLVEAAERTCRAVLRHVRADGWIPGRFDRCWRPVASYSCLTGNAQMAAQWFRLWGLTGELEYLDAARRATRFLRQLQDCRTTNPRIRGAIKASHPVWGGYLFGTYPNWAAKFFLDALLMEDAVLTGDATCIRCW